MMDLTGMMGPDKQPKEVAIEQETVSDEMNLTAMMADESGLTNLDWLDSESTFEPRDKDINKKDDLAIEWGNAGVNLDPNDSPRSTIEDEMDVKNNWQDADACVKSAKVFMHQGIMGEQLVSALRAHFTPEVIEKAMPKLKELVKTEGIVGCVAIDLRGEKDHKELFAATRKSPYKRWVGHVIMTAEEAEESSLVEGHSLANNSMAEGSIDGLFASTDESDSMRYIYKPLNMPVMIMSSGAHTEYVDEDNYGDYIVELAKSGELTEEDVDEINETDGNRFAKIRKAFRMANTHRLRKLEAKSSNADAPVESKHFAMESSDLQVEIGAAPATALTGVEIIDDRQQDVELIGTGDLLGEQDINEMDIVQDVEIGDAPEISGEQKVSDIGVIQDVDLCSGDLSDIDVDPQGFVDQEFEGIDEVTLEGVKEAPVELDVDTLATEIDFGE